GFAGGDVPSGRANLALLKGASLVGVFWGRFASMFPDRNHANFQTLNEWWTSGRIDPTVSEVFELDRAVEALRRLESRQAIGKLIVRPGPMRAAAAPRRTGEGGRRLLPELHLARLERGQGVPAGVVGVHLDDLRVAASGTLERFDLEGLVPLHEGDHEALGSG